MLLQGLKAVAGLFVAAIFALPAFATAPYPNTAPNTAMPGSLNYVEGQVSVNTELIEPASIPTHQLHPGDLLTTEQGNAEVLLTPGVFLRVGVASSVKIIASSLSNIVVSVDKGHAMVEVDDIHKQNDIRVIEGGANVRLLKTGLYDFDLRQNQLRVFDGKAKVEVAGHEVTVKRGHDLDFTNPASLKSRKFDPLAYENDDLYRWSSLRSAYLAETNVDLGDLYAANQWAGWYGPDWYWDPWFDAYTFLPGDGICFSPFGWGFYSPWLAFEAPFDGGFGFGHGEPRHHHFSQDARNWGVRSPYLANANYSHGVYHGPGSTGAAFHSGPQQTSGLRNAGFSSGFHGGGVHASGGGFHGGGGFGGGGGFSGGGFGGGGRR